MKVGMVLPEAGQQATRGNVVQAAKQAEEERFDSLWVWERLLCPINPQTPYPNAPDGSFPIEFQNVLDTLETLTFVAANTNRIGKKDEMTSHAMDWMKQWGTATSDPNGQIRTDGKQLASDIGVTLVNCETYLNDHDKLMLTQMMDVINDEIDRNVDLGPPCDPMCKPGPPISSQENTFEGTSRNDNNISILNNKLNEVVDFCLRSLSNGTSTCENELSPAVSKVCAEENAKQFIDACNNDKVAQYYKTRNISAP